MVRSVSSPTPGMPPSTITPSEGSRDMSRIPSSGNVDRDQVYAWILELTNPDTREHALIELR